MGTWVFNMAGIVQGCYETRQEAEKNCPTGGYLKLWYFATRAEREQMNGWTRN